MVAYAVHYNDFILTLAQQARQLGAVVGEIVGAGYWWDEAGEALALLTVAAGAV